MNYSSTRPGYNRDNHDTEPATMEHQQQAAEATATTNAAQHENETGHGSSTLPHEDSEFEIINVIDRRLRAEANESASAISGSTFDEPPTGGSSSANAFSLMNEQTALLDAERIASGQLGSDPTESGDTLNECDASASGSKQSTLQHYMAATTIPANADDRRHSPTRQTEQNAPAIDEL